jgi:hypothetical protein
MALLSDKTRTKLRDKIAANKPAKLEPVALGDKVKDIISGFTGIVAGWQQHLHGCDRLEVEPTDLKDDGGLKDAFIFDVVRLTVLEKNAVPVIAPKPEYDKFVVGAKIKDRITGSEGIVGVRVTKFGGDVSLILEPGKLTPDGKPVEPIFAAASRFDFIAPEPVPVAPEAPKEGKRGGPSTSLSPTKAKR